MGKTKEKVKEEEDKFEARPDLGSAQPFTERLDHRTDYLMEAIPMLLAGFSMIGMMMAQPLVLWTTLLIIFSIHINRDIGRSRTSQMVPIMFMVLSMIVFLYYRMHHGYHLIINKFVRNL